MSSERIKAGLVGLILALGALLAISFVTSKVFAADKGGSRNVFADAPAAAPNWNGPSIAIGAGWTVGAVDFGGPVDLSASGPNVSAVLGYDKQWGSLVGGVGLGYSHYFGDLETVGINHDIFGYARLGVLVSSNALLYGHLGYGRLDTDAGSINGFRFGPGVEIKLSGPFSLDLRWTHGIHDVDKIAPGVNAASDEFAGRLVYRFNP